MADDDFTDCPFDPEPTVLVAVEPTSSTNVTTIRSGSGPTQTTDQ